MSKLSLAGRATVITRAARGIRLAIARRFAEYGRAEHLLDLDAGKLDEAAHYIADGVAE